MSRLKVYVEAKKGTDFSRAYDQFSGMIQESSTEELELGILRTPEGRMINGASITDDRIHFLGAENERETVLDVPLEVGQEPGSPEVGFRKIYLDSLLGESRGPGASRPLGHVSKIAGSFGLRIKPSRDPEFDYHAE